MDVRTLKALEWDRVLALLSLCASTREGRRRAASLAPAGSPGEVALRHGRVREIGLGETLRGRLSFEGYRRGPTRVPTGIALPLETLRDLRACLRVHDRARAWLGDPAASSPLLEELVPPCPATRSALDLLERTLDDRGEVADGASPKLQGLRREREQVRGKVSSLMEGLVTRLGGAVLRQESYTVRNGRLVLPVQTSRRSEVKGILHDSSSTGATSYIEPLAAVEMNNRLAGLDAEEREEIRRILLEVSAQLSGRSDEIESALDALEALDLVCACARLGKIMGGRLPELEPEGARLRLLGGRHPLLDPSLNALRAEAWGEPPREAVVPLDLSLALSGTRTLVVSGPNAGGKSVALKTAGLLCAMSQAGLPVPAQEGTVLPVFATLYAAVGDSQSILDSLSTFSARMVHLKEALDALEEPFLAVLDELGAGTDPAEGAALGEAILLHLHRRRGYILCSTHQEALKARALVTEGMGNAGMEFSEGDLRPTFRLQMGRVGASRALETAARAGLPCEILDAARGLLPREEKRLKEVLDALEEERAALEKERARAQDQQEKSRAEQRRLQEARAAEEETRRRFVENLPERLRAAEERFLAELRSAVDRQAVRRASRDRAPKIVEAAAREAGVAPGAVRPAALPSVGDRVAVEGFGLEGRVLSADPGTGRLRVECGGKTLQVGFGDVRLVAKAPPPARGAGGAEVRVQDARTEINLIGKTVAEAADELEAFLDRAAMAGLRQVRIIHGIGTGRLRAGLHAYLKKSPYVSDFEDAPPSGGGAGATWVTLAGE